MGVVNEVLRVAIRANVIIRAFITFIVVFFTLSDAGSTKRALILLHGERFFFDSLGASILLLDCLNWYPFICILILIRKIWKLQAYNLLED
jgi:hypothetical protein